MPTTTLPSPSPPSTPPVTRRLPVGAEVQPEGGVHFRVWAPHRRRVHVVLEGGPGAGRRVALAPDGDGHWAGLVADATAGTRYRYQLDDGDAFPDPAARYQPEGPHGPSEVVDPDRFAWTDAAWNGLTLHGQVIYELHVGTFTPEGTWAAAMDALPALVALGVTCLEVMPVAEFPGRFGWGYDGVGFFAPTRLYGTPDDFRRFVDRAHALGLGVILDVVYNHFGPDGNYLREFAPEWVSTRHQSEWGDSPNYDGPLSEAVRAFFVANAGYWIAEYHLDGLRLDATQSVVDDSPTHVLVEIGQAVRAAAERLRPGRGTLVVNENEPQDARLVRPVAQGGRGLDMIWNDDWHHAALVALTGQDEAYFTDYRGTPQEFVSAAKHGFLFQGQWYRWQRQRRGSPTLDVEPARFVHFLANHDQVANSGRGERPHQRTSPGRWRALTALLLLGPQTPMLFMGQEWNASTPFLYFADHEPGLAEQVAAGRRAFMTQFANMARPAVLDRLPAPHDPDTFARCRLDHAERTRRGPHRDAWTLHRDLLHLRRTDPTLRRSRHRGVDGAVLGADAFALRFFGEADAADVPNAPDEGEGPHAPDLPGARDRLLVVNLGRALHLDPVPEPLLAPPAGMRWAVGWSSNEPRYGGLGTLLPDAADDPTFDRRVPDRDQPRPWENWRVQGECALLLVPVPVTGPVDADDAADAADAADASADAPAPTHPPAP